MKAVIAQFIYEANTFSPRLCELEMFTQAGTWKAGERDVRAWAKGVDSQLTGSLEELAARGWNAVPVFAAMCGSPAGRISRRCFDELRRTMKEQIAAALPADVVIMHLHGAASAEGEDDVEGNLLEMVRREIGYSGYLVLSLDLHANMTPRMARCADVVTAYHTMPHMDFSETGRRAAKLAIARKSNTRAVASMKALIPPIDTNHFSGRFAEMLAIARAAEQEDGIDDVALLPVQPWLDIADLRSTVVVSGRGTAPARVAQRLAEEWYAQRHAWETRLLDWNTIRERLLDNPPATPKHEPWVLVDTADATTGGSEGRSVEALRQLLPIAERLRAPALLWVVDPEAVEQANRGATHFRIGRSPLELDAEVVFTGEGSFTASGQLYPGMKFSMCGAAVLKRGQLHIVVSREPLAVVDHAFYECVGLKPREALAVQSKSIQSWRAGFVCDPSRGLYFDGPGCTSLNLATLPFKGEGRDLFPMRPEPENPIAVAVYC
jgi:microcystin degradation protein MlrC